MRRCCPLASQVNPDGTVAWAYPSNYFHTHRERVWAYGTMDTDQFHAGASLDPPDR